ncbi:MAG: hypothetical protein GX242_04300 [Clostridiales bacterium]|nr:hypothetical protein [Clostridiales bacterium]
MEATMKMSNLVLPQGFVEMDREEMCYVSGGLGFDFYWSNSQVWNAVSDVVGGYKQANLAIQAGMQTSIIAIVAKSIKTFAFAAKVGAIPVIGWIALGILAAAAVTVATVMVGCMVSGKGFGITFTWDPKWYNPANGLSFNAGWR